MGGSAINREAFELNKKIEIMIFSWQQKNRGKSPRYIFLSKDAYLILKSVNDGLEIDDFKTFMGIEIAPVGVPGVYAAIGESFY